MVTDTPEDKNPKSASGDSVDSVRGAWKKVGQFFVANPTLVLSLLYALLTGYGILSSWSLYTEFGINIFDYAEIGDFLVAAFKSPGALYNISYLLMTTLIVFLVYASLPWVMRFVFSRSSVHSAWVGRLWRSIFFWESLLAPILFVALAILYSVWGIQERTKDLAQDIKNGGKPKVTVQYRSFSSSAGQVTKPGLKLIGSTQRFVFFYDENIERTIVIPQAQIIAIKV